LIGHRAPGRSVEGAVDVGGGAVDVGDEQQCEKRMHVDRREDFAAACHS